MRRYAPPPPNQGQGSDYTQQGAGLTTIIASKSNKCVLLFHIPRYLVSGEIYLRQKNLFVFFSQNKLTSSTNIPFLKADVSDFKVVDVFDKIHLYRYRSGKHLTVVMSFSCDIAFESRVAAHTRSVVWLGI